MFVSLLASATGVLAGLLFLASFLMSGAFAGDVPSGSNAAGLVVPLFCSIGAGLLLLIAVWSLLGSGRLAWVGAHAGMVATVVTFGVGVSAVGTLLAWMERTGAWVTPLGWFCGALAPLLGVVLVLRCAWQTPEQLQAAPLLLAALCGLGLALWGATLLFRQAQRQFIVARALQVPDFELDLERTVNGGHPVYRHGAIDLMREAPAAAKKPLWSSWLARAIALSAEQIATDPKWLQPDASSNPQPIGHLRAMIDASQRLGRSEEVDAAIQKLRASLQGLPDGPARSQALDAIGH